MQNMWMSADDVVELLEKEWQSIAEGLGEKWDEFRAAYQSIIAPLPETPTRADVERIADEVCSLLAAMITRTDFCVVGRAHTQNACCQVQKRR